MAMSIDRRMASPVQISTDALRAQLGLLKLPYLLERFEPLAQDCLLYTS